jgi:cobalt/nickel transport protein
LELIPSLPSVSQETGAELTFDIIFTHPMAGGPVMDMEQPAQFGVLVEGERHDLRASLEPTKHDDKSAFRASYTVTAPGSHIFYVEPAPYYAKSENTWITHYTKVYVDTYDFTSGWKDLVGLPVEIRPLVRPHGLWTGNTFRGEVLHEGKPAPYATIEVEFLNEGGKVKPPTQAYETQIVLAGANGEFAYTAPRAGWWCFAALIAGAGKTASPEGEPADVELGGLLWLHYIDMK